jgi:hypothetical protein
MKTLTMTQHFAIPNMIQMLIIQQHLEHALSLMKLSLNWAGHFLHHRLKQSIATALISHAAIKTAHPSIGKTVSIQAVLSMQGNTSHRLNSHASADLRIGSLHRRTQFSDTPQRVALSHYLLSSRG